MFLKLNVLQDQEFDFFLHLSLFFHWVLLLSRHLLLCLPDLVLQILSLLEAGLQFPQLLLSFSSASPQLLLSFSSASPQLLLTVLLQSFTFYLPVFFQVLELKICRLHIFELPLQLFLSGSRWVLNLPPVDQVVSGLIQMWDSRVHVLIQSSVFRTLLTAAQAEFSTACCFFRAAFSATCFFITVFSAASFFRAVFSATRAVLYAARAAFCAACFFRAVFFSQPELHS